MARTVKLLLTLRLSPEQIARVRAIADRDDTTKSAVIRRAIAWYVADEEHAMRAQLVEVAS